MHEGENTSAVFELFDSTLATMTPDLLGLWATQATDREVSFGVDSQPDIPLWRANFPGDLSRAEGLLASHETRLKDSQTALGLVPERIGRLIEQPVADGLSFDPSATAQSTQAERTLLTTLQALQDDDYQSFGLGFGGGKERSGRWQQASE